MAQWIWQTTQSKCMHACGQGSCLRTLRQQVDDYFFAFSITMRREQSLSLSRPKHSTICRAGTTRTARIFSLSCADGAFKFGGDDFHDPCSPEPFVTQHTAQPRNFVMHNPMCYSIPLYIRVNRPRSFRSSVRNSLQPNCSKQFRKHRCTVARQRIPSGSRSERGLNYNKRSAFRQKKRRLRQ
jgi:hypothetical protein